MNKHNVEVAENVMQKYEPRNEEEFFALNEPSIFMSRICSGHLDDVMLAKHLTASWIIEGTKVFHILVEHLTHPSYNVRMAALSALNEKMNRGVGLEWKPILVAKLKRLESLNETSKKK